MSSLRGLHVLVVRALPADLPSIRSLECSGEDEAEADSDTLMDRLEALGATCYHYPVIKIVVAADDDASLKQQMMNFAEYDKAIVVSRRAGLLAGAWLDRYWPILPTGTEYFAVGPTSAVPLKNTLNITALIPDSVYSSEGLLALPQLKDVAGNRIIILKGTGGRDLLERTLKERGAVLDGCELYRRVVDASYCQAITALLQSESPLVLVHSGEVLEALLQVTPEYLWPALKALSIIVPGQRVADLVSGAGFASVHIASSALPQDMERKVLDWYTHQS